MRRMIWVWVISPFMAMPQAVPTANTLLPFSLTAYKKNSAQALSAVALAAAGAFQTNHEWGVQAENRFMLKDMTLVAVAKTLRLQQGSLGFSGHFNGGNIASSFTTGATTGLKLREQLGIGICMRLTGFKWAGQPIQWGIQAGGGILYCINTTTAIGFHLDEWLPIGAGKENPGSRFREIITGIGTAVNTNLYLALEIRKRTGELPGIGGLLEWQLDQATGICGGINTANNILMMGMKKQVGINVWGITFSSHPQLGFSMGLTMNHGLGK